MTNQYSYELSLNILKALGGDMTVQYENADQIWAAIDGIYAASGDGLDLQALVLNITENGTYDYNITDEVDAYVPVNITVDIKQKYTDEQVEDLKDTAREEGYTSGYTEGETTGYQSGYTEGQTAGYTSGYDKGIADGYVQGETAGYSDGYSEGLEDGAEDQKALLEDITIRDNGVYEKEDGYKKVTVEVPIPTFETESLTKTLKTNGTYNYTPTTDGFSDVYITVDVPTGGVTGKTKIYNGFRFTGGDLSKVDFSQYDWSGVYDTKQVFVGCDLTNMDWEHFKTYFNGKLSNCDSLFTERSNTSLNAKITTLPNFGELTKECISFDYMCYNIHSLNDFSNIQYWNTSNVLSANTAFANCGNLTSIPLFDTSKVTNMSNMFYGCSKLTTVPLFDTSKVTNMSNMFRNCSALTEIPQFDTSNVTDMRQMFEDCSVLTEIPQFDTSNVTTMYYMLRYCSALTEIPQFDTSNVTDMQYMLYYCSALTEIPQLDTSKVTNMSYMLTGCKALTTLGGFINMGMQSSFSAPDLSTCTNLTKESIMNVINNLYDRKSAGYATKTLTFGSTNLAKITDEEKAIATNKGWTLS